MIERAVGFKVGTQVFVSLEAAQEHELGNIIASIDSSYSSLELARELMKHSEKIVDILTTTATSKSRARRVHGGTKTRTRKATTPAVPEGNGQTMKGVVS